MNVHIFTNKIKTHITLHNVLFRFFFFLNSSSIRLLIFHVNCEVQEDILYIKMFKKYIIYREQSKFRVAKILGIVLKKFVIPNV